MKLTVADLMDAAMLHHLAAMGSRRTIVATTVFAVTIAAAAFVLDQPIPRAWLSALIAAGVIIAYLIAVLLLSRWFVIPRAVRRQAREQKSLNDTYDIDWNEAHYGARGPTAQSETPWAHYLKWRDNDRVMLLYLTSKLYQVIPKRSFSEPQLDDIRRQLGRAEVARGRLLFG